MSFKQFNMFHRVDFKLSGIFQSSNIMPLNKKEWLKRRRWDKGGDREKQFAITMDFALVYGGDVLVFRSKTHKAELYPVIEVKANEILVDTPDHGERLLVYHKPCQSFRWKAAARTGFLDTDEMYRQLMHYYERQLSSIATDMTREETENSSEQACLSQNILSFLS